VVSFRSAVETAGRRFVHLGFARARVQHRGVIAPRAGARSELPAGLGVLFPLPRVQFAASELCFGTGTAHSGGYPPARRSVVKRALAGLLYGPGVGRAAPPSPYYVSPSPGWGRVLGHRVLLSKAAVLTNLSA